MTSFREKCAELRRKIAEDPRAATMTTKQRAKEWGVSEPTVKLADAEKILRDNQSEKARNSGPGQSMGIAKFDFSYEGKPLRVLYRDGKPEFIGKDAAEILGYADPNSALSAHCKSLEKLNYGVLTELGFVDPPSSGLVVIPESDLYRLILRSHLPSAEKFQDWVVCDVLPQIRKTGSYSHPVNGSGAGLDLVALNDALEAHHQRVTKSFSTDLVPINDQLTRLATVNSVQNQEIREQRELIIAQNGAINDLVENQKRSKAAWVQFNAAWEQFSELMSGVSGKIDGLPAATAEKAAEVLSASEAYLNAVGDGTVNRIQKSEKYRDMHGGFVKNTIGYLQDIVLPETAKILEFQEAAGPILRKIVDNTTRVQPAPKEEPQRAGIRTVKVGHYDQSYRTSHEIAIANGYPKDERSKGMTNSLTSEIEKYRHEKMGIFEIYIDYDGTKPIRKHDRKTVDRWLDEGGRETINAWTAKALAKAEAKERDD